MRLSSRNFLRPVGTNFGFKQREHLSTEDAYDVPTQTFEALKKCIPAGSKSFEPRPKAAFERRDGSLLSYTHQRLYPLY
jgi:hypothetical protein